MAVRPTAAGISRSLAPLRDVVASLASARDGAVPSGNDRRRLVRRARAAGAAAVPALIRALASPRADEAAWASYLLGRVGGGRVVERVSGLLEDPRLDAESRARALRLLGDLNAVERAPSPSPPPPAPARSLLDGLHTEDDLDETVALIEEDIGDDELPAFIAELISEGGSDAAPLLDALLASDRHSPATVEALERMRDDLDRPCAVVTRPRQADERTRAFDLLEQGDLATARQLLERVVATTPDDGEARSFLGVCCLQMDEPEAGLPHLDRAATLEPDEPLHYWNLAAAARAAGQMGRCYSVLRRYLELDDRSGGSRERRRAARGFARDFERTVRRVHPDVALEDFLVGEDLFCRAFSALTAGRYDEAVDGFERVLTLVPEHVPSWGNLGAAWFALGHADEASRCLRRALTLNPDYEAARENLQRLEGP